MIREGDPAPGYYCELSEIAKKPRLCPICLASNTNITTSISPISVTKIAQTSVPKTHLVIHLVLSDKREIRASPNHPTVTSQTVGALRAGDIYDGSRIAQINLVPYWDDATYDILPNSFTGAYLANGIWLGSTLDP